MTTTCRLEAPEMLLVECPMCDAPAPLDAETGELTCSACDVRLALADEAPAPVLAAAA